MISAEIARALRGGQCDVVVTAGQRLARTIRRWLASTALDDGRQAWTTPEVMPYTAWLRSQFMALCLHGADTGATDARLLTAAQSHALWREVIDEAGRGSRRWAEVTGTDGMARAAADAYRLMCRWHIPVAQVRAAAYDDESAFFTRCIDVLEQRRRRMPFLLEAELPALLLRHADLLAPQADVLLAGFDQLSPDQALLLEAWGASRMRWLKPANAASVAARRVVIAAQREELVAAGQWVRDILTRDPMAHVAVIAPALTAAGDVARRALADGLMPGYQAQSELSGLAPGFEVSYGRPLADWPAVAQALALLQLAVEPPRFEQLSLLLRSPLFGVAHEAAIEAELALRELADRQWSLSALVDTLGAALPIPDWLSAVSDLQQQADARCTARTWSERIADTLERAGWLAATDLDSENFQLRNAFFGALNALAALDVVLSGQSLHGALASLQGILRDALFQPEGQSANVLLAGPLETIGMHFDAVWISGLDDSRWPAPAYPNPFLPRALQREYALPDATPAQTMAFWQRQLELLAASGGEVVFSHAEYDDDGDLRPTPLLPTAETAMQTVDGAGLAPLAGTARAGTGVERIAALSQGRRWSGGYQVLQWQASDPLSAMCRARWHCAPMREPAFGLGARDRGIVLHAALETCYRRSGARAALAGLGDDARLALVEDAVAVAMRRYFKGADPVLKAMLRFEERRARRLVARVLEADLQRADFRIVALEQPHTVSLGPLSFRVRVDRVDAVDEGVVVIDYKTGGSIPPLSSATILTRHVQLAVYAQIDDYRASLAGVALALVNDTPKAFRALVAADDVLARSSGIVKCLPEFDAALEAWHAELAERATRFAQGDLRLNAQLAASDHLPLATLTRAFEMLHDD